MAFPLFQDATGSQQSSFTTTHTITNPTTVTVDDIWLAAFTFSGSGGTVTGPTGWTEILSFNINANQGLRIWARRVDGTEGATSTVTTGAGNRSATTVRRYSAVSTEDIGDVVGVSAASTGFGSSPNPGSVSASWGTEDNVFVAFACHTGRGNDFTAYPASYGNGSAQEETNDVGVAGADRQLAATSDDPGAFTIAADENWAAATVVLKPVVGLTVTVNDTGTATDVSLAETDLSPRPADSGIVTETVGTTLALAVPPQEFPVARLRTRIEAFIPGGPSAGWVDLSDRLLTQQLDPSRGRADESSETDPSSVTMELDNADGWLTPGNGNSPWYPWIDQGLVIRISVEGGDPALVLDGSQSTYASTPDHPDYGSNDIDIRIRVEPDAWSDELTWSSDGFPNFSNFQRLVTKWVAATGNRQWNFFVWGDGYPSIEWSTSGLGSGGTWLTSYRAQAAVRPTWLAMTLDANDGAGSYVGTVWRSDDPVPPTDVTTWAVVEQFTGSATSVYHSTADILVGALNPTSTTSNLKGRVLEVQIRSSINGPLVANPKFTEQEVGTKSFVDEVGKSWSLSGAAEISRWRTRFVGTTDEILPYWPHGDNESTIGPLDLAGEEITLWGSTINERVSEHRVSMTVNGILRRLGQGSDPLDSPLYRHITGYLNTGVDAYWPVEDSEGASTVSAGLITHGPMTVRGTVKLGADDSLISSAALATIENGVSGGVRGAVTSGNASAWTVDWFFKLPEAPTSFERLITVQTPGEIREAYLEVSTTAVRLTLLGQDGSIIDQGTFGAPSDFIVSDDWKLGRIDLRQSGSDVVWEWTILRLSIGSGNSGTNTVASVTLDRPSAVDVSMTGPPSGYSFGHIVVTDGSRAINWMSGPDIAWVGESAAYRFKRLCLEEGIPCEMVGGFYDYTLDRGDILQSLPMGPQGQKTLLELLNECVKLDGVMMIERRTEPGLIYRFRGSIENQTPQLILDAQSNHIINPLEPRKDDQRLRNDVEVKAEYGGSARVIDQDSVDDRKRYRTSETVAGVGGVMIQDGILFFVDHLSEWVARQNYDIASWILHLGTWPGMRYPTLVIPLDVATDLIGAWMDLELGDRIQVVNLPAQHPDETIELIVEHVTESMSPMRWRPELTCSPGGPWLAGELQ